MCIQFTLNSLAIRFFAPRGVDKTELFWIYLGYERDTEEQSQMRVMQSNLTGAAGLVSLEDGCINEFVQRGTRTDPEAPRSWKWAAARSSPRRTRARRKPPCAASGRAIARSWGTDHGRQHEEDCRPADRGTGLRGSHRSRSVIMPTRWTTGSSTAGPASSRKPRSIMSRHGRTMIRACRSASSDAPAAA